MAESILDGVARRVLLDNDTIEELKDIAKDELGVEIVLGEPDPNLTFDDLFPGWSNGEVEKENGRDSVTD